MEDKLRPIVEPLMDWYEKNRRDLPWRGTKDPYKVLVSEIMLQQTRVAAVLPYYARWMEELPDTEALAAVSEERLMKLWQGLGYYSRARNLKRAAERIVALGRFPDSREALLELPGVGDYTAGAVASIAFGRRVPAVDGNVLRVAARITGAAEDILDPAVRRRFRGWMEAVTPAEDPGGFNQALMDLGAMVCLPGASPDCARCPLAAVCEAKRLGQQAALPVRRKKAARRVEERTVYILLREGRTALRRREERGLLAGLWEFPGVPGALGEEEAGCPLAAWSLRPLEWRKKLEARHIFTHVEWRMTGYVLRVEGGGEDLVWADRRELEALAVPSAFARFLEEARRALEEERG